ncbi:MAG: DUF1244 domain-containing protein [Lysobacter sp.]|nr:DUF1244 domain-containing protein [Lysobacter sp.]
MIEPDLDTISIEAAIYRRLVEHLMHQRTDVRDRDLMSVAGFCRNGLAQWYREAAEARGITLSEEEARESVYGMPWQQCKAMQRPDITADVPAISRPPEAGRC